MIHGLNPRECSTVLKVVFALIEIIKNSPYAASIIELKLGDGTALKVPSFLLRKCPKLHTKIQTWTQIVSLLEITQDIGHVLVHYLFTNTYQCLLPKGTAHEKMCSEYRTAIRVYGWTRDYELSDLNELAKAEVIRLGSFGNLNQIKKRLHLVILIP